VTDELIALYAGEEKLAKYIDMPLQHINDAVLQGMHRLGNRASITELVERLRARIPGLTFRTAFIVGFPGETEAAFSELARYVEAMEFDRAAVFLYSDEEGTGAADLAGKLARTVMEERRAELLRIQEAISLAKNRARIGSTLEVMVDGPSEENEMRLEGRHEGLAPEIDGVVYLSEGKVDLTRPPQARRDLPLPVPGDFVKVRITGALAYDLVGRLV
jgi:ribosomal protein S12 methylthiotransferase